MPLPELIEILPLSAPVSARVTVPGSKSITNRALILAALARGVTTLRGALWSEDTQVMTEALTTLGFEVSITPDGSEPCNRTISIRGLGGEIPRKGEVIKPLDLFVGNAGTAARFLAALVCLGRGTYRLHGTSRMHKRPQAALFAALRELGYRVEATNDKLPAVIYGTGPRSATCTVSIADSSQFASALLLAAKTAGWQVTVEGENAEESPYVRLTAELIAQFPKNGGEWAVEPDASSGSYFWAAYAIQKTMFGVTANSHPSTIPHWPASGWQIDAEFPKFLPLNRNLSRARDLGDSIMTAIVLAAFGDRPLQFTNLARLRLQECERVQALRTELTRCGAKVIESGDTLEVFPSRSTLHGAAIETYNDHRMAMCFAIVGLAVPGIQIKNPACVKKTFPNFFAKLAALPSAGLGVTILNPNTGTILDTAQLVAD